MIFQEDVHVRRGIYCEQMRRQIVAAAMEEQGKEEDHVKDGGSKLEGI
jgi:hypothetical protein